VGVIAAVFTKTFMMAMVFQLYHLTRRVMNNQGKGYFIIVFYWIAMEYLDLNWELNWPWLDLGNGFANWHVFVQWYEYTGVLGGTLWILLVNIIFFIASKYIVFGVDNKFRIYLRSTGGILLALFPLFLSYVLYHKHIEKLDPVDVVVVQPNNDPYTEQYELPAEDIMNRIFTLSDSVIDQDVEFIICPESTIQEYPLWERRIWSSKSLSMMKDYIEKYPNLKFVIGSSTYRKILIDEEIPSVARKFPDADRYFVAYNTALYLDSSLNLQKYYKSKLTPGVEHMPFNSVFSFVEDYALDLGGTIGTLGVNKERTPFITTDSIMIAPVICYESVFGEFVSGFVRNGAQALFIITNDGWWRDTPGHRQHMKYASLRAIETRRSIARSANTGVSCIIDQRGDIQIATDFWEPDVIRTKINLNDEITFYVKYGDYIGRVAWFGSGLLLLITLSLWLRARKKL
jgi:apolipoprotein N-acyltransferase